MQTKGLNPAYIGDVSQYTPDTSNYVFSTSPLPSCSSHQEEYGDIPQPPYTRFRTGRGLVSIPPQYNASSQEDNAPPPYSTPEKSWCQKHVSCVVKVVLLMICVTAIVMLSCMVRKSHLEI